jgi:hypothetical protein
MRNSISTHLWSTAKPPEGKVMTDDRIKNDPMHPTQVSDEPDMDEEEDEEGDEDKQSDLDVPGGKGLVSEDSRDGSDSDSSTTDEESE